MWESRTVKKVVSKTTPSAPTPKWMSAFGGLRDLHNETVRINRILECEFEQIEDVEWRPRLRRPGDESRPK